MENFDPRLEGDKNINAITDSFVLAIRHFRSPDDVEMSLADQFRVIADRLDGD